MLEDDIDYGMLLWPDSFKFKALTRAKEQAETHPELWELYQKFFALFGNTSKPPVPFSAAVSDLNSESSVFPPISDLMLSVVVVTRNDLHVERMQDRTQAFINGIVYLAESNKTKVELIIVEWNPPSDRKPFAEQFKFLPHSDYCTIKIVTVPVEVHNTYKWADRLPLYQMIGKNAGVRRARGQFVLATNIDILLSQSLFEYITDPQLSESCIYRSNRWDVDMDILDVDNTKAQLDTAFEKCFRINYREGGIPIEDVRKDREKTETFDPDHMWYPNLHTEGCGDFQMLHRNDWYKVRGYAETDCFCYHMDSLFAFTCHFAGIKEEALSDDYPHFHIDHTVGTVVNSDVYTIAEKKTVRHISCESIIALSSQMFHEKDFLVFNRANWGLSDHDLPTTTMTKAAWERPDIEQSLVTSYGVDPTYGLLNDFPLLNSDETEEGRRWLQDCTISLHKYINHFAANRGVYIWGYGKRGQYCKKALEKYTSLEIKGFIQSTPPPEGAEKSVIPIYTPDRLNSEGDKRPFFIVTSIHAETIRHTIEADGFLEGVDFLIWS